MSKTNNQKLRFKEFTDEWQEKKLGEVVDFKNGKAHEQDISENGKYTVINSKFISTDGLVRKFSDRQICPVYKNDIVMVMSDVPNGKAMSKCFLVQDNDRYTLNQRICALTTKKASAHPKYLISVINRNPFYLKFDDGVKQTNLRRDDVTDLPIIIPEVEEQEKVAGFLTAMDEKISKLEEKKKGFEKYKKGVMQAIFSQKIRFKKPDGSNYPDWEEKKLGELLDYEQPTSYIVDSTEYNSGNKIPVLTAGKTFILGYTDETNGIYENLPVIIFDDFTTASQFVDFPFKVKSSAMKMLKTKSGVNIRFAFEAIQRIKYEIGGHGRHWISKYSKIKILMPDADEQEKIAEFLTELDNKVDLINKELEQVKLFKKSLLQQMFA